MGTLNRSILIAASTGYRTLFHQGREAMNTIYPALVMPVASTNDRENYQLAPLGLSIREWKGDRRIKDVKVFDYTLVNKDYEGTIGVERNAFLDDKLGHYNQQFIQLGMETTKHPDELLATLLSNGFAASTGAGYDGAAFFSDAHLTADGANNRDNLVTGAFSAAKFEEMVQLLRGMKAYNGKPLNPIGMGSGLCLMVGSALESTAKLVLEATQVADSNNTTISNINYGRAELVVNPYLGDTEYYLFVKGGAMKPFIHQTRQAYQLVVLNEPTNETLFYQKKIVFGVDGREAMGYGHFELIIGSQGA